MAADSASIILKLARSVMASRCLMGQNGMLVAHRELLNLTLASSVFRTGHRLFHASCVSVHISSSQSVSRCIMSLLMLRRGHVIRSFLGY
jgi:hypothetical protein